MNHFKVRQNRDGLYEVVHLASNRIICTAKDGRQADDFYLVAECAAANVLNEAAKNLRRSY